MIIQTNKDVLYNYNKKKKELFFIFYTKDSLIYTVKGWFGKKLYELLKSGEGLETFIKGADFKADSKLVEVFKRLIVTLIREDIFESDTNDFLTSISSFSKEEYLGFGEDALMNSLVIEELNKDEEILAYAHEDFSSGWHWDCIDDHEHITDTSHSSSC